MTPEAWDGHGLSRGRPWACRSLPYRWREVEIHHVDMGAGYEPDQWPHDYVTRELHVTLATLPDRLADDGGSGRALLALAGRPGPRGPRHHDVGVAPHGLPAGHDGLTPGIRPRA